MLLVIQNLLSWNSALVVQTSSRLSGDTSQKNRKKIDLEVLPYSSLIRNHFLNFDTFYLVYYMVVAQHFSSPAKGRAKSHPCTIAKSTFCRKVSWHGATYVFRYEYVCTSFAILFSDHATEEGGNTA